MVKKHLFRLNAPKSWPIERKKTTFVLRPFPGPHSLALCMPLGMTIREVLKLCKTRKEAKNILNSGKIKVNGKVVKEEKTQVGFMDVIDVPDLHVLYRCTLDKKGRLSFKKIEKKEAEIRPVKIIGKTAMKKGKIQLNLSDGTNVLVDKDTFKRNDTVVLNLHDKKIEQHLPFQKGMLLYIMAGKNVGEVGKLEEVKSLGKGLPDNVVVKTKEGTFETRKDFSLVIGKDHEVVSV